MSLIHLAPPHYGTIKERIDATCSKLCMFHAGEHLAQFIREVHRESPAVAAVERVGALQVLAHRGLTLLQDTTDRAERTLERAIDSQFEDSARNSYEQLSKELEAYKIVFYAK